MATRANVSFDVTSWEQTPYEVEGKGPQLFRAKVQKAFRGDLVGESTAELLMCVADPSDLGAGAGYVGSERVIARLAGRDGTFVLQHWGISGGGGPQKSGGHVVPGSGTGELAGLSGQIEISADHTFTLDYELP
jgi:hypothetical protein